MSIKSYYFIILSLFLSTGLVIAQEEAAEEEAAVEEAAVEEAAVEEATVEEAAVEEAAVEEPIDAEEELLEYVEEAPASPLAGFNVGFTGSMGFVNGEFITNTPVGGSLVISTPYGFKLGEGLRFNISLAFGSYTGESEDTGSGVVRPLDPTAMGVGGNLTLAKFVFAEGHVGIVGAGTGIRGFAGVSLERIMKKSLGLPVNILIGGEGFISTEMAEGMNESYWGGLGIRLDYSL